jgi:hypothetical protein
VPENVAGAVQIDLKGGKGYLPLVEIWDGADDRVSFSPIVRRKGKKVRIELDLAPGEYWLAVRGDPSGKSAGRVTFSARCMSYR